MKKKSSWKEVKISGKLLTDDNVGHLEGFVGLEILEDYDNQLVSKIKPIPRPKEKRKIRDDSPDSDASDSDSGKKSKSKKKKKGQNKVPSDININEDSIVGRFVRPLSNDESEIQFLSTIDLEEWNTFGLSESILRAIADNGYKRPTQIQSLVLPPAILGRRDILGAAETGSGKTLAFGLPILNGILEIKEKLSKNENVNLRKIVNVERNRNVRDNLTPPPEECSDDEDNDSKKIFDKPLYALILTPTRELAVQVRDHIKAVAIYTDIKVEAIFGGLAPVKQKRLLKNCPEIVVATPGRLWELLNEGDAHLSKMDDINFFVIDETDRMLERGHFEELQLLLERINRNVEKKAQRQNFVFSATLTLVHDIPNYLKLKNIGKKKKIEKITSDQKIQNLIEHLGISQPKVVDITKNTGTADALTECRIVCPITQKDFYLYYFLQRHPGRTIVFCNSIDCVRRLAHIFSLLNCKPLPLHATMIQKQRLKNLERFRHDPYGLLIATDVAARGLDIPNVQHVIHYQVPRTSENYVHRSGRTARANNEGITILIMEPGEVKDYHKMCRTLGRNKDLPIFPISYRHLSVVKERVNLAREVDKLDLQARRTQNEIGWREKAAEEMDIVLNSNSENDDSDQEEKHEMNRFKKLLKLRKQELTKLLSKPLFPKGFNFRYPSTEQIDMSNNFNSSNAVTVMKDAIDGEKIEKMEQRKKQKMKKIRNKNKQKSKVNVKQNFDKGQVKTK